MLSLRDSGKLVGSAASVKQVAQQCKLPFPLSLRQFINTQGCPFSRCNRLHLKVLTDPTNFPIETMLNRMREVYSNAGIGVVVASREALTADVLGDDNFTTLNDLDVGECRAATTNEQDQLFENQNNVPDGERDHEIVVFFVRTATTNAGGQLNGCAAHPDGRPGAVVAQIASQWTLAHEVGHVLDLRHIEGEHTNCPINNPSCCSTPDFTRLMTGCSTSNITGTPTIDTTEIKAMKKSNLTRQC
jgi:hypothetical protein